MICAVYCIKQRISKLSRNVLVGIFYSYSQDKIASTAEFALILSRDPNVFSNQLFGCGKSPGFVSLCERNSKFTKRGK